MQKPKIEIKNRLKSDIIRIEIGEESRVIEITVTNGGLSVVAHATGNAIIGITPNFGNSFSVFFAEKAK